MPLLLPSKKMTTAIVDRMSGAIPMGEKVEETASSEKEYDMALESACEDIFNAIETKNVKLFMQGMKDFHSIYDEELEAMGYGEEEEEEEKEGMED